MSCQTHACKLQGRNQRQRIGIACEMYWMASRSFFLVCTDKCTTTKSLGPLPPPCVRPGGKSVCMRTRVLLGYAAEPARPGHHAPSLVQEGGCRHAVPRRRPGAPARPSPAAPRPARKSCCSRRQPRRTRREPCRARSHRHGCRPIPQQRRARTSRQPRRARRRPHGSSLHPRPPPPHPDLYHQPPVQPAPRLSGGLLAEAAGLAAAVSGERFHDVCHVGAGARRASASTRLSSCLYSAKPARPSPSTSGPTRATRRARCWPWWRASGHGWFEGYDWVVRLNPDVLVRNDTFLLQAMGDDAVHGIFVDCLDRPCPTGRRCEDSMHSHRLFCLPPPRRVAGRRPAAGRF